MKCRLRPMMFGFSFFFPPSLPQAGFRLGERHRSTQRVFFPFFLFPFFFPPP